MCSDTTPLYDHGDSIPAYVAKSGHESRRSSDGDSDTSNHETPKILSQNLTFVRIIVHSWKTVASRDIHLLKTLVETECLVIQAERKRRAQGFLFGCVK